VQEVHEGACQQEQVRQNAEKVRGVLGNKEERNDGEKR